MRLGCLQGLEVRVSYCPPQTHHALRCFPTCLLMRLRTGVAWLGGHASPSASPQPAHHHPPGRRAHPHWRLQVISSSGVDPAPIRVDLLVKCPQPRPPLYSSSSLLSSHQLLYTIQNYLHYLQSYLQLSLTPPPFPSPYSRKKKHSFSFSPSTNSQHPFNIHTPTSKYNYHLIIPAILPPPPFSLHHPSPTPPPSFALLLSSTFNFHLHLRV